MQNLNISTFLVNLSSLTACTKM